VPPGVEAAKGDCGGGHGGLPPATCHRPRYRLPAAGGRIWAGQRADPPRALRARGRADAGAHVSLPPHQRAAGGARWSGADAKGGAGGTTLPREVGGVPGEAGGGGPRDRGPREAWFVGWGVGGVPGEAGGGGRGSRRCHAHARGQELGLMKERGRMTHSDRMTSTTEDEAAQRAGSKAATAATSTPAAASAGRTAGL